MKTNSGDSGAGPATFVGEATGGKPNHFGEVGSFRLPVSRLLVTYAKKFFNTMPGAAASRFPDATILSR